MTPIYLQNMAKTRVARSTTATFLGGALLVSMTANAILAYVLLTAK